MTNPGIKELGRTTYTPIESNDLHTSTSKDSIYNSKVVDGPSKNHVVNCNLYSKKDNLIDINSRPAFSNDISKRHSLIRTLGASLTKASSSSIKKRKFNACDSDGNLLKPAFVTQEKCSKNSLDSILGVDKNDCCVSCEQSTHLYSLSCSHNICNKCISPAAKFVKCIKCNSSSKRNEVVRFHAKSIFSNKS